MAREPEERVLAAPVVPATRPVATPARGVSTDAQPRSQELWEAAFPGESEPPEDAGAQSGVPTFMEADRAGGGPAATAEVPEAPRTEVDSGDMESRPIHHEPEPNDSDDELIMDVDCVSSQHT